jgi:nucleoside-diphosphate-sugar epimerase
MKVALVGGTGFVGSYLVDELLRQGHDPVLLVRPGSEHRVRHAERCGLVSGDLDDHDAVRETVRGCDAAVYNVGILREAPARGVSFEALHSH